MLPFEQSSVGVSPRWFSTPGLLPSRPFCGHTTTRPVFLNHSLDLGPSVFRNLYQCLYQIKSRELWLDIQGKDWFQLTCRYLSGVSFCWTAPFKMVYCSFPTYSFAFLISNVFLLPRMLFFPLFMLHEILFFLKLGY